MSTQSFAPNPFLASFPFVAPAAVAEASEPSFEVDGEETYALVQTGPAVPADEVESHLDAVEVTVRWGAQTMKVAHLGSSQSFALGEGADFAVPEALVGGQRFAIVEARGAAVYARIPGSGR